MNPQPQAPQNQEAIDVSNIKHFDYKDTALLRRFLSTHGRILSRRRTGLTAVQQHALSAAVKRSRFMGLIPYVEQ